MNCGHKEETNMQRFEYWKSDKNDKWYFHLRAVNNEVICASQGYKTKQNCIKGIESVKKNAGTAEIFEIEK